MRGTLSDQWSTSEPWTPILTPIPTRINIRVNLLLPCAIPVTSWYVTNTRGEIYWHPCGSATCPLCQLPHCRFCCLFSFLHSGIPVIKSHCVWPDDDGYHNTERAQRISLNRRRSKSQSWAIKSVDILSHEPVSRRNSHPFMYDV